MMENDMETVRDAKVEQDAIERLQTQTLNIKQVYL